MSFFRELTLHTSENGFTDITGELEECVRLSSVREGICVVFCPHTTAGIKSTKTPTRMSGTT